ncbi:hypothetical protein Cs7R123_29440 [Catellatospora sp. TT07R-123]|nr:hypothetical protein Cs7R123_29440 [Catellatospora sp. TT07R-123]
MNGPVGRSKSNRHSRMRSSGSSTIARAEWRSFGKVIPALYDQDDPPAAPPGLGAAGRMIAVSGQSLSARATF